MNDYVAGEAGHKLGFKFQDPEAPANYALSCSINTNRKVDLTNELSVSLRKKNTDPKAPARPLRRVKSQDIKFTGAGTADMPSFVTLVKLWQTGTAFSGKLIEDAETGFTITGMWQIETMSVGGESEDDQVFDISLAVADPDFEITFTAPVEG
jgi:hypothetical protein